MCFVQLNVNFITKTWIDKYMNDHLSVSALHIGRNDAIIAVNDTWQGVLMQRWTRESATAPVAPPIVIFAHYPAHAHGPLRALPFWELCYRRMVALLLFRAICLYYFSLASNN